MNSSLITEQHAKKVLEYVSYGLVKGLGIQQKGQMCVEAAVCAVFGLPHGDNPPCVGAAVRRFKIEINDKQWSSNEARAAGLKRLAIAQLGSNEISQREFVKKLVTSLREASTRKHLYDDAHTYAAHDYVAADANADAAAAYDYDYAAAAADADADAAAAAAYDKSLSKSCEIAVQVLIEMNCPGTKFLHLCPLKEVA